MTPTPEERAERLTCRIVHPVSGNFDMRRPSRDEIAAAIRAAEQAARAEALEEAAKVCNAADKSTHPADLADMIRALKEKP